MYGLQPIISIDSIIFIFLIAQGFILSFMLFISNKGNINANTFLAILILVYSILEVWDVLLITRLILFVPHLLLILNPLIYILGPMIYFYVKALTNIRWKFRVNHLLHFIPSVLWYLIFSHYYFLNTHAKVQMIADTYLNGKRFMPLYFFIIVLVQLMIYLFYSLILLRRHANNIKNNFSYTERINLRWLRNILVVFILIWLSFSLRVIFFNRFIFQLYSYISLFSFYFIGYFGYNQPVIFQENTSDLPKVQSEEKKKYQTSSLNDEEINKYSEKLHKLMVEEKLYLKNDLKLNDVAEKMKVSGYHLSQIFNEKMGKKFYDFINEFRVEEVKRRLANKEYTNLTILAVGFDSGFNSKTAFYTSFKNLTGVTPTEYKRQLT